MAGEGRVSTAWGCWFSPVELPAGKGQGSEREEGCEHVHGAQWTRPGKGGEPGEDKEAKSRDQG